MQLEISVFLAAQLLGVHSFLIIFCLKLRPQSCVANGTCQDLLSAFLESYSVMTIRNLSTEPMLYAFNGKFTQMVCVYYRGLSHYLYGIKIVSVLENLVQGNYLMLDKLPSGEQGV